MVQIYLFYGDGCPHCAAEETYLDRYLKEVSDVVLTKYEVWHSEENQALLKEVGERINSRISGVPFTLIGDRHTSGFSESITVAFIKESIEYYRHNPQPDIVLNQPAPSQTPKATNTTDQLVEPVLLDPESPSPEAEKMNLPVFGEVNPKSISLPLLAVVIGTLDGFNPCSLWVLLFLISLLIGLEDRKKIFLYGGTFILVEAFAYTAFMAAWLNLMLFIGMIGWVRTGLGIAALIGGLYSLRNFLKSQKTNGGCSLTSDEKREKTLKQVKSIAVQKTLWLALVGIAVLAFSVNLIELLCSAGLPAVFTQVLSLNQLSPLQYAAYIALYIIFFMFDDLIVFCGALLTMKLTGISTRYAGYSHLVGGIIMAIIGLLLVFKPELLFFG